jgi:phage terminase large subunit GpA-like protein
MERATILIKTELRLIHPPPKLTVSQWAEQKRYLSRDGGASQRWRNETAPYLVEIMDAASDPSIESIVYEKPTQVGGTEVINNIIGYYIDQEPCRILYAQQTLETAEDYSKELLQPMFRDTPCLRGRVHEARSRDANSTILRKRFPGGSLKLVGANSPRGFRMTPQRIVIGDDVDGFERNAGDEGSPIALMIRRTSTYPDRKIILVSSPTIEGTSEIDNAYKLSDQRIWEVPCPNCGEYQELVWTGIRWPSPQGKDQWYSPTHEIDRVRYVCAACEYPIEHRQKREMNLRGRWRARERFMGRAGFHHNALVSAFESWTEIVRHFLREKDDPKQFKVFKNTKLAETWKVTLGEQIQHDALYLRREAYGPDLPQGVVVLTAAVDVQESPARLEVEVKGWGVGEESWGIAHHVFHGHIDQPLFDPQQPDDPQRPNAWRRLDEFLGRQWHHPLGLHFRISCAFIDSGHRTKEVYQFVRTRQFRQIFAIKGSSERGAPIVNRPKRTRKNVMLIVVGTDTAKRTIYDRLKKTEPGPGYMHWSMDYSEDYFRQVTAEHLVQKMKMGHLYNVWELQEGRKNEGLDLNVYSYSALCWLIMRQGLNLERLKAALTGKAEKEREKAEAAQSGASEQESAPAPAEPAPTPHPPADSGKIRQHLRVPRGFVKGWR